MRSKVLTRWPLAMLWLCIAAFDAGANVPDETAAAPSAASAQPVSEQPASVQATPLQEAPAAQAPDARGRTPAEQAADRRAAREAALRNGSAAPAPTVSAAPAAPAAPSATAAPKAVATGTTRSPFAKPGTTSSYRPASLTRHARGRYLALNGIENLQVRRTGSGSGGLIRFSYRVVDPARATALGDKKFSPVLIGHTSNAMLQVPVMDKVGALRQSTTPQAGQELWTVFSNKGDLVKRGERVSVIIGPFRADGLLVE